MVAAWMSEQHSEIVKHLRMEATMEFDKAERELELAERGQDMDDRDREEYGHDCVGKRCEECADEAANIWYDARGAR